MKLTKEETQAILELPTIATYNYGFYEGVEIKRIDYGIDDYVIYTTRHGNDKPRIHKVKIRYDRDSQAYIFVDDWKIYLNECLRNI